VVDGVADRLPVDDASFDAVVSSLVLCSVPDPAAALAEVHRVLRLGGRFFFWEHVRGDGGLARVQGALDAAGWPFFGGGCHVGRDTAAAIAGAGFTVERIEGFRFPETRVPMPASPQILGVAVRPERPPSRADGQRSGVVVGRLRLRRGWVPRLRLLGDPASRRRSRPPVAWPWALQGGVQRDRAGLRWSVGDSAF
jgi:SAM-dependent methyltransferase